VELAAKELLRLGCETVIITMGAQGSYVADPDLLNGYRHSRSRPLIPRPPATCTGCLAVAITEDRTLADSARFAAGCGDFCDRDWERNPLHPSGMK